MCCRLNFSNWGKGTHSNETGAEAIDAIQSSGMPPFHYLVLHRDAALSARKKQQLVDGLRTSLR